MAEVAGLSCKTEQEIEEARVRLLGKKGSITALFEEFRTVAPELKREYGQKLNVLKNTAAAKSVVKCFAEHNTCFFVVVKVNFRGNRVANLNTENIKNLFTACNT